MDLLETALPSPTLKIDIIPSLFFDNCEALASQRGWRADRRRKFAGDGYDQLNLHLGSGPNREPMLRMVSTPDAPDRIQLDVVARWTSHPIEYDEYTGALRMSLKVLLSEYNAQHGTRFRIRMPNRPAIFEAGTIDCARIGYAAEKFDGLTRSLAVGAGDARQRLIGAFRAIHVIRPNDLPPPLDKHLAWVYSQVTKRPARHDREGSVDATVWTMRSATAATILERLVDIAEAIEKVDALCSGGLALDP